MKEYHLHKGDYSKLQLTINDSKHYCKKNIEHCFKPHRHSFFQIIWFKNSGSHFVDYVEYEHPENTVFFLTTGQVHSFCKESENDGLLFHFNDLFLQTGEGSTSNLMRYRLFNEMSSPLVVMPYDEFESFRHISYKLISEIENKQFNYKQQLYYYFQILLLGIERLKRKNDVPNVTDHHFELALKFKNLVNEYRNEFKSVAFFSQLVGVSDKTLNTVSKKYHNATPANFIHKAKILEAKRLLANTQLSKKEIAYQLGFEQPTYFTKYFKKHTSLTPKEFQASFL